MPCPLIAIQYNCVLLLHDFTDLLIDIADVMDIDVYRLGHTYMQLSKTICISIPSVGEFQFSFIVH